LRVNDAPVEGIDSGNGVTLVNPAGRPDIVIVGVAVVFSVAAMTLNVIELFGIIVMEPVDSDKEIEAAGGGGGDTVPPLAPPHDDVRMQMNKHPSRINGFLEYDISYRPSILVPVLTR
jgi:hypothetical protein